MDRFDRYTELSMDRFAPDTSAKVEVGDRATIVESELAGRSVLNSERNGGISRLYGRREVRSEPFEIITAKV